MCREREGKRGVGEAREDGRAGAGVSSATEGQMFSKQAGGRVGDFEWEAGGSHSSWKTGELKANQMGE